MPSRFRELTSALSSRKWIVLSICLLLLVILSVSIAVPLTKSARKNRASSSLEIANSILEKYPLIDGHNDLPYKIRIEGTVGTIDLNSRLDKIFNYSHTDIPRLRKGKLAAQFWSTYVKCDSQYKDAVKKSLEQIDIVKNFVAKYPNTFQFVTSAKGIMEAFKNGKIGSLVGLEGGHSIDSSLGALRMFYDLGVRYMTITHSCNTPWADNWMVDINKTDEFQGLTSFGEKVINEMNRIGMLVDLSHVSKDTMADVLRLAKAPVIYSHSSAFTICNHYRNVQDDILNLTKTNGGVVMVNFYNAYINCYPHNQTRTTLKQVADHIDHIKNLVGVDYVGIGGDYDGVEELPEDLEDVSKYPNLFAELVTRGWNEADLAKLAGGNLLRVFEAAEKVRDEMSSVPPDESFIPRNEDRNTNCSSSFTAI